MKLESVLVWNGKSDAIYREARRVIASKNCGTPKTIKDIDFASFFENNPNVTVYFPVFQRMNGWWGELLETDAKIMSKTIITPECQLYEIGFGPKTTAHQLYAAEISPKGSVFNKMREFAITIKDMIATDSGTIMTMLSSGSEDKVRNLVRLGNGEFLGHLGGY